MSDRGPMAEDAGLEARADAALQRLLGQQRASRVEAGLSGGCWGSSGPTAASAAEAAWEPAAAGRDADGPRDLASPSSPTAPRYQARKLEPPGVGLPDGDGAAGPPPLGRGARGPASLASVVSLHALPAAPEALEASREPACRGEQHWPGPCPGSPRLDSPGTEGAPPPPPVVHAEPVCPSGQAQQEQHEQQQQQRRLPFLCPEDELCHGPRSPDGGFFEHVEGCHYDAPATVEVPDGVETAKLAPDIQRAREIAESGGGLADGITTVMVRFVPRKYTEVQLMREINDAGFDGRYDFLYLPRDIRGLHNRGFAFMNFVDVPAAREFYKCFAGARMRHHDAEKDVVVLPADVQGFERNAAHYASSCLLLCEQQIKGRQGAPLAKPLFLRPLPPHLDGALGAGAARAQGSAAARAAAARPRRIPAPQAAVDPPAGPAGAARFCTFCGRPKLRADYAFCAFCGRRLLA